MFQCTDGSDEHTDVCTSWNCTAGLWKCNNGKCINESKVCDESPDCDDGSDNDPIMCADWPCPENKWKCADRSMCIDLTLLCDGDNDCQDGLDEDPATTCANFTCPEGESKCPGYNLCIPSRLVCDGDPWNHNNCPEASDEKNCADWTCAEDMWKCADNKCISASIVCDGETYRPWSPSPIPPRPGCLDQSEEDPVMCANWTCPEGMWKCANNIRCTPLESVCDGIKYSYRYGEITSPGCPDDSDEDPIMCAKWICPKGRWKCANNIQCIDISSVCDGDQTCSDNSDEDNEFCTRWTCPKGRWKCFDNVTCIDSSKVCDGSRSTWSDNCQDGSDEDPIMCATSPCPDGRWKCTDNFTCIDANKVCDAFSNCPDGSDEDPALCPEEPCPRGQWKCPGKNKCILENYVLNGIPNCEDGADENPKYQRDRVCLYGQFQCDNGQCIEPEFVCDGLVDRRFYSSGPLEKRTISGCVDRSDEGPHCKDWKCHTGYWKCSDNKQCIRNEDICDLNSENGGFHCIDGSDEHNILCNYCYEFEWSCHDGKQCVNQDSVCDGQADCNDGSDEFESVCFLWSCSQGRWKCKNNKCIDNLLVCDGSTHCKDGSDEQDCDIYTCSTGKSKCADNICIDSSLVCDNSHECSDMSDELCYATCLESPLVGLNKAIVKKCTEAKSRCYPAERFCDKVADCPYGSDECSCGGYYTKTCVTDRGVFCIYNEWLVPGGSKPKPCFPDAPTSKGKPSNF